MTSWLSTRQDKEGFLLHALRRHAGASGKRTADELLAFLVIEPIPERLQRAAISVPRSACAALETDQGGNGCRRSYTRQDKPFVRKAGSGDWRTKLPAESVQAIESAWGDIMKALGYKLSQ